jgi:protease I
MAGSSTRSPDPFRPGRGKWKKILFIVGDFAEDYEVMAPFQALMLGHSLDAACPAEIR